MLDYRSPSLNVSLDCRNLSLNGSLDCGSLSATYPIVSRGMFLELKAAAEGAARIFSRGWGGGGGWGES